ncbi:Gfo/Idh/MocA family oxidoreductase [Thomasclavelia sp.]|uniref:Gfo/Idh/MocA family oxidoreductase n=1 Tax=Thomasclavelia sp. TaxID=3025757 RepID=UPI0025DD4944|nr:Gfo/Idh/MocA family oxidoreductase [Thomasclavelia sp.]
MAKKLTVGFIGNGKSANRYHIPFIQTRKDKINIKKIYTRNHAHDKWDEIPGVIYCEDLNDLLTDQDIDVIIISTPSTYHYEYAKMVLNAGKNCVVEKPFASTYQEAKEIFDLAKEKGLMVQCYQNRRFDSDFLTVQKVIESGKLGDLLELEMHFDYYRPYIPESAKEFSVINSYLYGHGCHTLDQVISYFGKPDHVHYDVRQLLGEGRMNDYFDLDLYYGNLKVSVKSSYFRVKERPSFIVYGKKGMFIKEKKDKQEEHLKLFYLPEDHEDFGIDLPNEYGTLIYYDENGKYHEEKVESIKGDYGYYYDALYETLINHQDVLVTPEQTLLQIELLENGIQGLK